MTLCKQILYRDLEDCLYNTLKTIEGVLDHINIDPRQKDFWTVLIGEAICNFKHAVELKKNHQTAKPAG